MGRILVIEDDSGTQVLLRGRLVELGHEVVVASTGAMGLMEARAGAFDLFLVDVHLGSGIDGNEVCRRVKAVPQLRGVPVVLLTAHATREELHRGYEAGCEAFLTKSDSLLLEDTVRVMLRTKALQDDLAEQNRLLARRARAAPEEDGGARLAAALESEEARALARRELGYGRPDGVLLADADGVCRFADRGARELLGKDLEGRHLGSVVPASRLEAYVRDARTAHREGYGFDLTLRKGGVERHLTAAVLPLAPRPGDPARPLRVVLLEDGSRRRLAADLLGLSQLVPRREVGVLVEAARSVYRPEGLLGASPAAVALRAFLESEAESRRPVWIHGEAGSGRHTAARVLHFAGFSSGSLVPLDCRAIAPDVAERELFGVTGEPGAEPARPGALHEAHLGTLLLFEPETLPAGVQEALVEALRTGAARRVGARRPERAEARLVVVTGAPPEAVVGAGGLVPALAELLERRLHVPPLRERPGDVAHLARCLIARRTRAGEPCRLTEEAIWVLEQHDWPGNVRELESALDRAVEGAGSCTISGADLPRPLADLYERYRERDQIPALPPRSRPAAEVVAEGPAPEGAGTAGRTPAAGGSAAGVDPLESEPVSLELYERHCLQRALRETGGNKLAAARLLNVGKSTFYRKLKHYGIG